MPKFNVHVHDHRNIVFEVEAATEEEAEYAVENSDNAESDFKHEHENAYWYIDYVEEKKEEKDENS
jgi:hypothetical protein